MAVAAVATQVPLRRNANIWAKSHYLSNFIGPVRKVTVAKAITGHTSPTCK